MAKKKYSNSKRGVKELERKEEGGLSFFLKGGRQNLLGGG